jgi:hypothetical protein
MVTEISLSGNPNQTWTVTIPGEKRNITFIITQSYNEMAGYWVLGIYDRTNTPIVLNIPLLRGHDLLEQYQYLNLGELYLINIGDSALENPDDTNIAANFKLLWVLL